MYEKKIIADCLTIKVVDDMHPENPRDWDNASTLVCWHERYTLGDEQPKQEPDEWLDEYKAANPGALIMPLFMYEHSDISLSVVPYGCRWDSGQMGYAVISAEKIAQEWANLATLKEQRAAAEACIKAEVETYSAYLNGEVFGYQVLDEEDEVLDSCYGFYSTEEAMTAGEEEARAMLPEAQSAAAQREADARLRDAAPDLLEAFEACLARLQIVDTEAIKK